MGKAHLTLVQNTDEKRVPSTQDGSIKATRGSRPSSHKVVRPLSQQLLFPFDEPAPASLRVHIVAMETVHGSVLNAKIMDCRPKAVLDLRHAAIFNQYGSSRDTIFGYFSAIGCYYSLVSMPWHNLSQRDFMTDSEGLVPRVRHELLEREPGSVMLFVPGPDHANMLAAYLNRLLTARSKVSWEVDQVH